MSKKNVLLAVCILAMVMLGACGRKQAESPEIAPIQTEQAETEKEKEVVSSKPAKEEQSTESSKPESSKPESSKPASSKSEESSKPTVTSTPAEGSKPAGTAGSSGNASGGNKSESSDASQEDDEQEDDDREGQGEESVLPTYEEYEAMTGKEQVAFAKTFESNEAFFEWYNAAKEEYEQQHPTIEIDGNSVDLRELGGQ